MSLQKVLETLYLKSPPNKYVEEYYQSLVETLNKAAREGKYKIILDSFDIIGFSGDALYWLKSKLKHEDLELKSEYVGKGNTNDLLSFTHFIEIL